MDEINVLRAFNTNKGRYVITQGEKYNAHNLYLKEEVFDEIIMDKIHLDKRAKTYLEDGSILRTGKEYSILMPKGGTGHFSIKDGEYNIRGVLKKGKLAELINFYKAGESTGFRSIIYWDKGGGRNSRTSIEGMLKKANDGMLQLHNQTRVMLKKIFNYLPK